MNGIDQRSLKELQELIGGDKDSLVELITTFLDEGKVIVSEMHQSLSVLDLESLRRCAHSLKSSAQDFGAARLSELCASLEYSCKATWPENAADHVENISEQFDVSSGSLQEYLGNLSATDDQGER